MIVIDRAVSGLVFAIRSCCSLNQGLWLVTAGVTVTPPVPVDAGTRNRNALVMFVDVCANARLPIASCCGTTWFCVFKTPTRTTPFAAFIACASASGHALAAALDVVMTSGFVGQNASCPLFDT